MAALPKRRISSGRKRRRRAQDGLTKPAIVPCPKCKEPKRPHFVCESCGHYGPAKKAATPKKETKK